MIDHRIINHFHWEFSFGKRMRYFIIILIKLRDCEQEMIIVFI